MDKLNFSATDIEIKSGTNKMVIVGCIATVGIASSASPLGADNKKVLISESAAKDCVKTFVGMPLNCIYNEYYGRYNFTGHGFGGEDVFCGFLEDVWVEDTKMMAKINIWKDSFPSVASTIINAQRSLGFSFEIYPKQYYINEEDIFVIDEFEGTGCALLWQNCAAFGESTYIEKLAASFNKKSEGDKAMTKEEMQNLTQMFTEVIDKKINELGLDDIKASIGKLEQNVNEAKENTEVKNMVESLKAQMDTFTTPNNIPAPKSKQVANDHALADDEVLKFEAKLKEIDDNPNLTPHQKMSAKVELNMKCAKDNIDLSARYKSLKDLL